MAVNTNEVQKLRAMTGAGILECKKALVESKGDIDKAIEILREKGIAKAAKRADRDASEGQIISYIHPGNKLGVLLEINCETDFVAMTDDFCALAKDIAMHIAASNPLYITKKDVPEELIEKETSIIKKQLEGSGKPSNVIDKIVPGKLEKFYSEICLLEQPYIKEPSKKVSELLTECIAKIGENILVKKFARFKLGEK
ncbi:translation elongation factor Ts [bacterium]